MESETVTGGRDGNWKVSFLRELTHRTEPYDTKAINQIFINLLDFLWLLRRFNEFHPFNSDHNNILPFLCDASSAFSSDLAQKSESSDQRWMLHNKLCFPLLINLFGIFRVEMRRQFSTDVNVSCSVVVFCLFSSNKQQTSQLIAFSASQAVDSVFGKLWEL